MDKGTGTEPDRSMIVLERENPNHGLYNNYIHPNRTMPSSFFFTSQSEARELITYAPS